MSSAIKTLKSAVSRSSGAPPEAPATDLHELARKAKEAYLAAVLAQAEGESIDQTQAVAIAVAAGYSVQRMANHVDIAKGRKAAEEAHTGRDWEGELQVLIQQYREAIQHVEVAKQAVEEAMKASREAQQRAENLTLRRQSLVEQRDRSKNEFRRTMKATGDLTDWRVFNLH